MNSAHDMAGMTSTGSHLTGHDWLVILLVSVVAKIIVVGCFALLKHFTNWNFSKLNEYDSDFKSMQSLLENGLEHIDKMKKIEVQQSGFSKGYFQLIEFGQFISLHLLDFLIVFSSYNSANSKWEKRFFCRQLALIIYEFLNDINPLIFETLRDNEDIKKIAPELIISIEVTSKKLSFIKQLKYEDYLKTIRHQTAAHRERDVQEFYGLVINLDEKLILACSLFTFYWIV